MVLNIVLLHSIVDIAPLTAVDSQPHTLASLRCIPPRRQQARSRFCQRQELVERTSRVFPVVQANEVPSKDAPVLHSHAEAVDELREGRLLWKPVQIVVLGEAENSIDGMKAWIVLSFRHGLLRTIERSRALGWSSALSCGRGGLGGADAFVGLPVAFLAFVGAVECAFAFCTAFERV